jgi:hypothetical protein
MAMLDPNAKGDLARVVQHKATIVRDSSQARAKKKTWGNESLLQNAHREVRVVETVRARFCASETAAATLRPQKMQNDTHLTENYRIASDISKQERRCALANTRKRLTESTKARQQRCTGSARRLLNRSQEPHTLRSHNRLRAEAQSR